MSVDKVLEHDGRAESPEWLAAQRSREVTRLRSILRSPVASHEEKAIAESQLAHWINSTQWQPLAWTPVMDRSLAYLLAKDLAVSAGYQAMRRGRRWTWAKEDRAVAVSTFRALFPVAQA